MSGADKENLDWRQVNIVHAADAGSEAISSLSSGETWEHLCDVLRDNGRKLLNPDLPHSDLDRATAFRHILAMLQLGINEALAAPHPLDPALITWRTNVYKYGHDCPDALYRSTPVRPGVTYRVHGTIGSARYMSFQLEGPGGTVGNLNRNDMHIASDGKFEAWFSPERHGGNWLETTHDTDQLFIRQFFSDWETEAPGNFAIEHVGADAPQAEVLAHPGRPERVAAQLGALADWHTAITDYYLARELTDKQAWRNAFMPTRTKTEAGGATEMLLGHGHFDLASDEALIIEVEPASALYWSLAIANPWRESLDYALRQTSLNDSQAVLDSDGIFRAVIAHTDPGVPNWLDTMGHSSGAMIFRWILADRIPEPRVTLVKHEGVRAHLPPQTPAVTHEQRMSTIARRMAHVRRRFT